MVNRIWPTAMAGKADSVSSVSASACHIDGPNSVNPGQILLVYGTSFGIFRRRYLPIVFYKVQEEMNANFAEKEMLSVFLLQFPK